MTQPRTAREQLAAELRYLRESAGMSERELADVLGQGKSTLYRWEKGHGSGPLSLPPKKLVEAWAQATGADEAQRARLRILVEAAFRGDESWERRLAGRAHLQEEMLAFESAAHTIRNFQLMIVPGLLQTPEYAHYVSALMGVVDREAAVAGRVLRQQALLDGQKRHEFLLTEAVLHWPVSRPEMLAGQLDRIVTLSALKSVHVAVLPRGEPIDAVAWSSFVILDGEKPLVSMELAHREETVVDLDEVDRYRKLYAKMWGRAVTGSDAVEVISGVAAGLRGRP